MWNEVDNAFTENVDGEVLGHENMGVVPYVTASGILFVATGSMNPVTRHSLRVTGLLGDPLGPGK